MTRIGHIQLLAEYNQWMNTKIYEAARCLSPTQLSEDKKAFFGSILGTLNHLVVADTLWLKRFANHLPNNPALDFVRVQPMPTALAQILFADIERLWQHRKQLDLTIREWSGLLTEADLDSALVYSNTKGIASNKPFFALLVHFFNHQTHHRGQVTTLLSQEGIDIGSTDLLMLIPND
ncbi:damage-inducible protein DinB [Prodigiosinella confusarubida]|uniref:Damage-inducible protein DinB n=1 Tax=Serratia sp. (strain ATCC 39006) TaxID=104623 RepID=A0A2I5TMA4_SERS3|nr:DinB family protein [Serratia sp. ATCC 39006]AUH01382.1 damage-inducible protein DinB [Serratia sp. ATCC 39006]AUH05703.1 damage-inducible protein DinB [Serratia sp. ATCC 39006]